MTRDGVTKKFFVLSFMAAPYQFTYSSHYAQAYMHAGQAGSSQPQPSAYASQPMYYSPEPRQSMGTGSNRAPTGTRFQPGHQRCTKSGCNFTGSPPSVETHMMDRHLIYPPDWHKRSKKPEWDTDPALKGYIHSQILQRVSIVFDALRV